MSPVERLDELCRRHGLALDTEHGSTGISLDVTAARGMHAWLWDDGTVSMYGFPAADAIAFAASALELNLFAPGVFTELVKRRDQLREAAEPATEAAQ